MRIPVAWRVPLVEERILILSPFLKGNRRATKETASHRNRFVAALSTVLLIPYARAGGVAEAIARLAVSWRKGVVTVGVNDQPLMQEIGAGTLTHLKNIAQTGGRRKVGAALVLTPE
jgi:predicted Rossmann fold nucleotide-binding protein DprA/Smf involved in DNA uptake